jgi:hypothetical protein
MLKMDKKLNQLLMNKPLKFKLKMHNKSIQLLYKLLKLLLKLKLKPKPKPKQLLLKLQPNQPRFNKQLLLRLNHKLSNKCKLKLK